MPAIVIYVGAVFSLTVIWALGALLLAAGGWRRGGSSGWPADVAAGIGVLAFVESLVVIAGAPLSPLLIYGLLLLLSAFAFRRRSRQRWTGARDPAALDAPTIGILAVAAGFVMWIVLASTTDRLWWDGWAIWALKGHLLHVEGGLPAALAEAGGFYAFSHVDYPLALPLLDWWVFVHGGGPSPALASFTGALLFALLPLTLWHALERRISKRVAAGAVLALAAFSPLWFFAAGGTADVLMALALLGAAIELEQGLDLEHPEGLLRAALFLTLGALSKNEGLALAVVALGVGGWIAARHRAPLRRLLPLLLPLAALAPWALFRAAHDLRSDTLAAPTLGRLLERAPVLVQGLVAQLTAPEWAPAVLLVVLGVVALAVRGWRGVRWAWLLVGGYFGAVCGVYLTSPQDLIWLLETSLSRVVGSIIPGAVFLGLLTIFGRRETDSRGGRVSPGAGVSGRG